MDRMKLKDRLQEAMEIRGLRAVDLVEKTGIPKVTISYYMSGKTEPRSDKLYKLAKALEVNEAWLMGYDVSMHRTSAQKNNDTIAGIVKRLRTDSDFMEVCRLLYDLDSEKIASVKQLVSVFQK